MKYERISLNERLRRAAEGSSTSPLYAQKVIQEFSDTPIMPFLEQLEYYPERQTLNALLTELHVPGRRGAITMGDIAVLITQDYMKGKDRDDELLQKLVATYFIGFDVFCTMQQEHVVSRQPMDRSCIHKYFLPVFDFAFISLSDFNRCIATYNLPDHPRSYIKTYQAERGCSPQMRLYQLLKEMKEEVWDSPSHRLYDEDGNFASIDASMPFIEFFVIPIAFMHLKNQRNELIHSLSTSREMQKQRFDRQQSHNK